MYPWIMAPTKNGASGQLHDVCHLEHISAGEVCGAIKVGPCRGELTHKRAREPEQWEDFVLPIRRSLLGLSALGPPSQKGKRLPTDDNRDRPNRGKMMERRSEVLKGTEGNTRLTAERPKCGRLHGGGNAERAWRTGRIVPGYGSRVSGR